MHKLVQGMLQQSGVPYRVVRHEELQSTLGRAIGSPLDFAAASGCRVEEIVKTLLVSGRSPDLLALVSLPALSRLDMKALATVLGCSRVEIASADVLAASLDYPRHGVSPIAPAVNSKAIALVIDEGVMQLSRIFVGTGEAGEELELQPEMLIRICPEAIIGRIVAC